MSTETNLAPPPDIVKTVRDQRFAAQCRLRDAICLRDVICEPTDYRYGTAHLAANDARSEDRYCEVLLLVMAGRIRPDNCDRYVHAITYPTFQMMVALMRLYASGVISRPAMEDASDRYDERCTYGWPNGKVYHRTDRLDREWRRRVLLDERDQGIVRRSKFPPRVRPI